MSRINAVNPAEATGKAKELLNGVQAKLGMIPNIVKTMAVSPALLESYLGFSGALANGELSPKLREQMALAAAESNSCEYCASAHTAVGKMVGLNEEEILSAREASSNDPKENAILKFVKVIVEQRGNISDEDYNAVRSAGLSESEIAEVIGNTMLNMFTNYFNHIAQTEIDFPKVELPLKRCVTA